MFKLSVVAIVQVTIIAIVAAIAAAVGPPDLWNNHENGDSKPLTSGVNYHASLFPLAITVRPTDGLWEGAQYLRTSGIHEGEQRKGRKVAFISLLHKYAHNAQGKISNWGRGTITLEAGFTRGGSVQATMGRLRARPDDFQTVSDVTPVHIAGFNGLSYDGRLKNGAGSFHRFVPFSSSDGSVPTTDSRKLEANYGKGEAFRIIVLNVRGTVVAIYLDSETAPADKFPLFLGFANRLLSTVCVSDRRDRCA